MKRASLFAAVAIVIVANAFALVHAWRNRSGPMQADVTLTERELPMFYSTGEDDSGVSLRLSWINPNWTPFGWEAPESWLNQEALRGLGFDISMEPSNLKAGEFYGRQRPRRVFVALEYDGPAWRQHLERNQDQDRQSAEAAKLVAPPHSHEGETRLVAIDAGADPARLRGRHPDRNSLIIVPAVVRVMARPLVPASGGRPERPARVIGYIEDIPSSIHVPRPYSDLFRRLPKDPKERSKARYQVHLRFGASYEPWVVGVAFAR